MKERNCILSFFLSFCKESIQFLSFFHFSTRMIASILKQNPNVNSQKERLFNMAPYNIRYFVVSPFVKRQNNN